MPQGPENSTESTRGFVTTGSNLAFADLEGIDNIGVRRRRKDLEERFGATLEEVIAGIKNPNLKRIVESGLAEVVLTEQEPEEGSVFASATYFGQMSSGRRAGLLTEENFIDLAYVAAHTLRTAEKELRGDVLAIYPSQRYVDLVEEYTASVTLARGVGKAMHDSGLEPIIFKNPLMVLMAGRPENIREGIKRLHANDFNSTPLETEELKIGIPMHHPDMAIVGGEVSKILGRIQPTASGRIFIPNTVGEAISPIISDNILDLTGVVQWIRVEETLNRLGVKERIELTKDKALQMISPHMTRRKLGIGGVIALGVGTAVGGFALWNKRHK